MLFVGSYVVQVTNKPFPWHLNPDLSTLFVTYIEQLHDWGGGALKWGLIQDPVLILKIA